MIDAQLSTVLVALTTLSTMLFVGLGFLRYPSRASAIWSGAFIVMMLASYCWVVADAVDLVALRGAASGAMLGAATLVWCGMRAFRDSDDRAGVLGSVLFTAVVIAALWFSAETTMFGWVFRTAFALAAFTAAATVVDLVRVRPAVRDAALPLVAASGTFVVFAVYGIVDGVIRQLRPTGMDDDPLVAVREVNLFGSFVYLVCALVSLLLLTRDAGAVAERAAPGTDFASIAGDRLRRAHERGDLWWSLLEIRLDDPADLRDAASMSAFEHVAARFAADVRAALPARADVHRVDATTFVALVPASTDVTRRLLERLLARLTEPDETQRVPVRLSASIGWAEVGTCGYALDRLRVAAHDAAVAARDDGGDRWAPAIPAH